MMVMSNTPATTEATAATVLGHMTPQQYTADGLQLTGYLRHRFHQQEIWSRAALGRRERLGPLRCEQRSETSVRYVHTGAKRTRVNRGERVGSRVRCFRATRGLVSAGRSR